MNKGDLIGYFDVRRKVEFGIVTSDRPFWYRDNSYDDPYYAVTVYWPNDPIDGRSESNEPVEAILSKDNKKIWLVS